MLRNSTLSGRKWSKSSGRHVDCTCTNNTDSDPLCCIINNTPANLSLHRPGGQQFAESDDQLYKSLIILSVCKDQQ